MIKQKLKMTVDSMSQMSIPDGNDVPCCAQDHDDDDVAPELQSWVGTHLNCNVGVLQILC